MFDINLTATKIRRKTEKKNKKNKKTTTTTKNIILLWLNYPNQMKVNKNPNDLYLPAAAICFLLFVFTRLFVNCSENFPSTGGTGNRTEWSPIRSVMILMINKADSRSASSSFVITRMITDQNRLHSVLLPLRTVKRRKRLKKNHYSASAKPFKSD